MFNYSRLIAVACHGIDKGLHDGPMSSCFVPTVTAYLTLGYFVCTKYWCYIIFLRLKRDMSEF